MPHPKMSISDDDRMTAAPSLMTMSLSLLMVSQRWLTGRSDCVSDLDPSMAAIAAFDTARPMLDIDHAISDIKRTACSTESIEIELHERSKAKEAVNAWLLEDSFVVSTHHAHCSVGDEHTTWR